MLPNATDDHGSDNNIDYVDDGVAGSVLVNSGQLQMKRLMVSAVTNSKRVLIVYQLTAAICILNQGLYEIVVA